MAKSKSSRALQGDAADPEWLLSEAEVFGPELFSRANPRAAELLAADVDALLRAAEATRQSESEAA